VSGAGGAPLHVQRWDQPGHHREVDTDDRPRPSPVELVEGALARVEQRQDLPPDPPGNEWGFALGVLFALGATGQLDESTVHHYETRIQAENRRLGGDKN
jgi:hypothetical protein